MKLFQHRDTENTEAHRGNFLFLVFVNLCGLCVSVFKLG